jgi:diguanylate cyclase (GGDEF)-like protein
VDELLRCLASLPPDEVIDPLTGVWNRGAFHLVLRRACETMTPVSLLEADIDFFKSINNNYLLYNGDSVLVQYARLLKSTLGDKAFLARTTGDGFSVLLPRTELLAGIETAERVRRAVEGWRFSVEGCSGECRLTVSIGVATFQPEEVLPSNAGSSLEDEAHEALLRAKADGRNRVFPSV